MKTKQNGLVQMARILTAVTVHVIGWVKLKTARTRGGRFAAINWTDRKLTSLIG